jgi:hypothetical protein
MSRYVPTKIEIGVESTLSRKRDSKNKESDTMPKFCSSCGAPLGEGVKFCLKCGTAVLAAPAEAEGVANEILPQREVSPTNKTTSSNTITPIKDFLGSKAAGKIKRTAGEIALPQELTPFPAIAEGEGLINVLKSGFRGLADGFKQTMGDKKRLGIVVVLAVIWLLVNLLTALGIFPLPVRVLSWITAARGSLIGGTIGKGLVAAMFAQIITDKGMLAALKRGSARLKEIISSNTKEKAPLLLGAGAALVVCNMIAFTDMQNTMTGVAGFVLSIKALTANGFLRRLAASIFPKAENAFLTAVMGGWASGFALFIIVSFLPGDLNGYLVGILLLIAGGVIRFAQKSEKGAIS